MKPFALAALLSLALPGASQAASVYNSFSDFKAAVAPYPVTTYTFDEDRPNAPTHFFGAFTTRMTSFAQQPNSHRVVNGKLQITLEVPYFPDMVDMYFASPVMGVGFDVIGAELVDVWVSGGDGPYDIFEATGGQLEGFFGVVRDDPIEKLHFRVSELLSDTFYIDNLVFVTAPRDTRLPRVGAPAPVPLPASVLFLTAGLAGMGALRAWQRSSRARH